MVTFLAIPGFRSVEIYLILRSKGKSKRYELLARVLV